MRERAARSARFARRYGPWALVCGASEGLGLAFADAVASRGVAVVLLARRADPLVAAADRLRSVHGVETLTIALDLAAADADAVIAEAVGPREIGLVVANAAHSPVGPFVASGVGESLRALDVNVRAPVLLAHRFLPPMVQRGHGGIVLVSSVAGLQGTPGIVTYAATKAFAISLAEGLWGELRSTGVDAIACCAGAVSTPGLVRAQVRRAPGTLAPAAVAGATLDRLGRSPRVVPGTVNRAAAFLLSRVVPRRTAITVMQRATDTVTGGRRPATAETSPARVSEGHRARSTDGDPRMNANPRISLRGRGRG